MTGHYVISWTPYDRERYAQLERMWREHGPLGFSRVVPRGTYKGSVDMESLEELYAMRAAAEERAPWEESLHLLDLAACEALMAAVQARIEQLRP